MLTVELFRRVCNTNVVALFAGSEKNFLSSVITIRKCKYQISPEYSFQSCNEPSAAYIYKVRYCYLLRKYSTSPQLFVYNHLPQSYHLKVGRSSLCNLLEYIEYNTYLQTTITAFVLFIYFPIFHSHRAWCWHVTRPLRNCEICTILQIYTNQECYWRIDIFPTEFRFWSHL